MKRSRLVFTGSGGQGVITAAILVAEAAVLHENLNAVQSQVYGPAARGGAARSDVIIADSTIYYPKVTEPNLLVCLTQESYNKYSSIIRPGGLLLTDTKYVKTERRVSANQVELPIYETVLKKIGKPIVFNICMLGVIIGLTKIVQPDSVMKVLSSKFSPALQAINRKALELGIELCIDTRPNQPFI
ncbi:2-oxoglutarate ferredoxin oxidoreductase subunit gamma [Desulfosarcina sp. BuS5]|uniref:2-oxoacid:acceptor oxidoreductase family protein n=1 Tax=Desulfosarcina sp. BuS5 TaxID=933262 RepID=UPI0004815F52|nr:2-oxoacid:acceptor oxidoreductase family protein [Desulfosarcina sp. BuS5]WDN89736.1 2-oxoglutarate ferredoxin oxidoreductase subunit gamma [Desulfosarcina sp. BuS5]